MKPKLSVTEFTCLTACAVLLLLATCLPAVPQAAAYHHFADQRVLWGVPFAQDALSNLPFALFGVLGLRALAAAPGMAPAQRVSATLFFVGLVATAACSGWYHLRPDDGGLAIDRLGMVLAFAGLLGLAAADRISTRAGGALLFAVLLLGPISIALWRSTGNVLPWAVLQFGGLGLLLCLACLRPAHEAGAPNLGAVVLVYALAKCLELADHAVFELTQGWVSGHTLKHVVASLAALPVIAALRAPALHAGQNAAAGLSAHGRVAGTWHNA